MGKEILPPLGAYGTAPAPLLHRTASQGRLRSALLRGSIRDMIMQIHEPHIFMPAQSSVLRAGREIGSSFSKTD